MAQTLRDELKLEKEMRAIWWNRYLEQKRQKEVWRDKATRGEGRGQPAGETTREEEEAL